MQHPPYTPLQGRRVLTCVETSSRRLDANELHGWVRDEWMKDSHRVRATPNTCNDRGWSSPRDLMHLRFGFAPDDRLKVANHARVRCRTDDRADDVIAVVDVGYPVTYRFAGGVF